MVSLKTTDWLVTGLDCPVCAAGLERACAGLPGVETVVANPATGRLRVVYQPAEFDPAALARAARAAGHPLVADRRPGWPGWLVPVGGAVCLAIGLGLEAVGRAGRPAFGLAALGGVAALAPKVLAAARQRTLDMNVLMATAMTGALLLGDWLEAGVLAVLFQLALWLERQSLARSHRALEALLRLAPPTARVEVDGAVVELPVEAVLVGQRLRLRPGDRLPLDGVVVAGEAAVEQAAVTGEQVPVAKRPGDPVYAGTIALDGALTVEVTHAAADSTLARVVKLVEEAQLRRSPTARQIDRFARWYTPALVSLAVLTAIIPPLLGGAAADWIYRGLVLLVLGCPCALVIATPVAIGSGLAAAARRGLLIRGGEPLEAAAELRVVAFDKTGTLTRGEPELVGVVTFDGLTEAEALALAAGLEADSTHPLAVALRRAAEAREVTPKPADEHRARPGQGVEGVIEGRRWWLGSRRLLAVEGLDSPELAARVEAAEQAGTTVLSLADDRPRALFQLAGELRPEAREALTQLADLGLTTVLLTGDNAPAARRLALAAGLTEVRAELLPEQKQAAIAELRNHWGAVAMVGDGINDAPALAAATVGVALGAAGSELAVETADAALLADDLRGVPALIRLARRTRGILRANIALALLIRLLLIPLALGGQASLWLAILGDMGSSLLVTANSLRLLRE